MIKNTTPVLVKKKKIKKYLANRVLSVSAGGRCQCLKEGHCCALQTSFLEVQEICGEIISDSNDINSTLNPYVWN